LVFQQADEGMREVKQQLRKIPQRKGEQKKYIRWKSLRQQKGVDPSKKKTLENRWRVWVLLKTESFGVTKRPFRRKLAVEPALTLMGGKRRLHGLFWKRGATLGPLTREKGRVGPLDREEQQRIRFSPEERRPRRIRTGRPSFSTREWPDVSRNGGGREFNKHTWPWTFDLEPSLLKSRIRCRGQKLGRPCFVEPREKKLARTGHRLIKEIRRESPKK